MTVPHRPGRRSAARAVGRGAQPLDAEFGLTRAGIEARDQLLQLHAVAFKHAKRPLQPNGMEQRRRKQPDQREFENPLHAAIVAREC